MRIFLALLLLAAPAQARTCILTVYEHANFRGQSWRVTTDQPDIPHAWDDRISSIIVTSGTWEFYDLDDYMGDHVRLTPGRYAWAGDRLDDQISSFRCVSR